jgi:hypothetical protein
MNTHRTIASYPLIAYIRVSTVGQGRSGLGIEVQREAIARFAKAEGLTILAAQGSPHFWLRAKLDPPNYT